MAQKLDEQPSQDGVYDDGKPSWRHEPNGDDPEQAYNAPAATDDDLPEGHPSRSDNKLGSGSDAKVSDPESLAQQESSGETPSGASAESKEQASLEDTDSQIGDGFKDEKAGGLRKITGRFSRRQKLIGGGVTGLVVGGGFGLFTFFSGPLQFVHFAQLLQRFHFSNNEEFANGRTGRYLRHLRKGGLGDAARSTRLSAIGNNFANRAELRLQKNMGLRSVYDTSTGRLVGYEMIDRNKAVNSLIDADLDPKFDFDTIDPSDSRASHFESHDGRKPRSAIFSLKDSSIGIRRKFTRQIVKASQTSKIAGTIAARLLITRGGVGFHPLNFLKRGDEKFIDFYRRIKDRVKEEVSNGAQSADDVNLVKDDGDPETPNDPKETSAEGHGQDIQDKAKTNKAATKASIKSKLTRSIGGASAIIGVLCTAREVSKNVDKIQYSNIILPLMRLGVRTIAVGNQVMSGNDVSTDELGALSADLYDETSELGWTSARSIQAEMGQEQTGPDIPPSARPSEVGNNPFLNVVDKIFDTLGPAGGAACSKIGGWITTAGELIIAGFTGGSSTVVTEAIKGAVILGASAAGVNPVDKFAEWLTDKLAGEEINIDAVGPDLGNLANYGARLAANDQALSMGGAKLSPEEVAQLDAQSRENIRQELRQKSLFARIFDVREPNSLIAKGLLENRNLASAQVAFTSSISSLANVLPNFGSTISKMFMPRVGAQASGYVYGFDEYGFSQADQDNALVEDPFDNAEIVEPMLEPLNTKYGKCFATTINPQTGAIESGKGVNYLEDKYDSATCNNKADPDLLRYRFYLADTITARSLACYEGDETSCQQLGFGGVAQTTAGPTPSPTPTTGQAIVGDIGESSDTVACAPGTTDLGVATSKYTGSAKKTSGSLLIRLCQLSSVGGRGNNVSGVNISGGAVLNSRVSGAWQALGEAAKAAGIPLTASSSFRLADSCGGTGDGGACARPGKSLHQLGVAIDFVGDIKKIYGASRESCSGRARDPSSQAWNWLFTNAEKYGFKQYSYEAWHWDPLNSASRCGPTQ